MADEEVIAGSQTALAPIETASDVLTALAVADAFRVAIDRIEDPFQLKDAITYAAMVKQVLARRHAARDVQDAWAKNKHRAERKIGTMLASVNLDQGGRPSTKTDNVRLSVRLKDLTIDPMQSSRWQTMARLTEEEFEAYCAAMREADEEVTSSCMNSGIHLKAAYRSLSG